MESRNNKHPILIIAGMHRSGTSLVSSLLKSAGLDIGQRLAGPSPGNVKGHFEDQDFVDFHVSVLESQGLPDNGFTLQRNIPMREDHLLRARELVNDRSQRNRAWGWKDPRTVLFLDFWQQLIPEADLLILYRSPWEAVDSLFRRGDEAFGTNPISAVRMWVHYNQILLDFHDRYPTQSLCVNGHRAAQSPELLMEALSQKFGLRLGPAANLFEESLFHNHRCGRWAALFKHHFPEAVDLYEALNERARNGPLEGGTLAGEVAPFVSADDWVLKDWLDLRILQGEWGTLRRQLGQSQNDVAYLREERDRFQNEAAHLRDERDRSQNEVAHLRDQLGRLRDQLREARKQIANMENTKVWKLRNEWFRIKDKLRRSA